MRSSTRCILDERCASGRRCTRDFMAEARIPEEVAGALGGHEWPVPWQPVWGAEDGVGSRMSAWAARASLAGPGRLPRSALDGLLGPLAALATRFDRRRSEAAHVFLRQAFGELGPTELELRTRRAWLHLLRVTVDSESFFSRVPPEETLAHHVVS